MRYESIEADDLHDCGTVYISVFNSDPWGEAWDASSALSRLSETFNTPGFLGVKALADRNLVGFAMGHIESYDDGSDYYLKEMCVDPGLQRRGIGRGLLDELRQSLRAMSVRKLYLLTAREGPAAEFYASQGFYTSEKMIMMGQWLKPNE
jgi:ribosomal protein S18 acetylase RimI-like enzyme